MGKKIDLNASRTSSSNPKQRRTSHSFSHQLPTRINNTTNNNGIEGQEDELSSGNEENQNNAIKPKASELSLRAAGISKTTTKVLTKGNGYELDDKINAIIKFPIALKIIIPMALFLVPFIFLMLFVTLFGDSDNDGDVTYGLSGYAYYEGACKSVKVNNQIMDIDEYIPGVLAGEVSGFTMETLKTFAVAARTYLIYNGKKVGTDPDTCYYTPLATNDTFQVYRPNDVNENFTKAAQETKGLVITVNGSLSPSFYDASCVYTASQAQALDSSGSYSSNYYYIKYGAKTIGGINFQAIPVDVASNVGTLTSWIRSSSGCYGNHGWGMSQNGAYYLENYEQKTWEEIINYYYQNKATIMSIYQSYGSTGDYPIDPSNELYTGLRFLANYSLGDLLSANGSNITSFNENISQSINDAGYGTREGAVAAAVTLIGSIAEMGYKINYEWGGGHEGYFLGAKSTWGSTGSAYCEGHPQASICAQIYRWQGLDCSGFVSWVLYNSTGKTVSTYELFHSSRGNIKNLSSSQAVCTAGDALFSSGHVVFVVGVDESSKNYIVAEATGYAGSGIDPLTAVSNQGGVKLSYYSFAQSGYQCLDLSYLY